MKIAVLSGKGGTGKTTVASSLIRLSERKVFADCDVDAPNLHQIFDYGEAASTAPFYGLKKAVKYDQFCMISSAPTAENAKSCAGSKPFVTEKSILMNAKAAAFAKPCPACGEDEKTAIRLEERLSGETRLYHDHDDTFSTAELSMGSGASGGW